MYKSMYVTPNTQDSKNFQNLIHKSQAISQDKHSLSDCCTTRLPLIYDITLFARTKFSIHICQVQAKNNNYAWGIIIKQIIMAKSVQSSDNHIRRNGNHNDNDNDNNSNSGTSNKAAASQSLKVINENWWRQQEQQQHKQNLLTAHWLY